MRIVLLFMVATCCMAVWLPYNELRDCRQIKMTKITKKEFISQTEKHYYVIQEKIKRIEINQGYRREHIQKCIDQLIEDAKEKNQ